MASDETRAKVMEHFPAFAWLLDNPEVAAVLDKAIAQEWTPDTFEANLRATQWWRTQTDTQRARVDMEQTDPATAADRVNALKTQIKANASTLGGEMTEERAGAIAWAAWRGGWSDQQVKAQIAGETVPSTASMVDVRQLAKAYMVDLPDDQAANLTRRVFSGELDPKAVESLIADQATSRFPQLGDWIKKGVRPAEFFAPYQQMIANMTGTTANQVDLAKSPVWSQIVSHADGTTIRPMTMDEATKYVRSTDEFAKSDRGQQEQASFVKQFAQSVGAMGA